MTDREHALRMKAEAIRRITEARDDKAALNCSMPRPRPGTEEYTAYQEAFAKALERELAGYRALGELVYALEVQ